MTTCPQCGAQNLPGMAYCEHCGSPLSAPEPRAREAAPGPQGDSQADAAIKQAQAVLSEIETAPAPRPAAPSQPAPPAHAAPSQPPPPAHAAPAPVDPFASLPEAPPPPPGFDPFNPASAAAAAPATDAREDSGFAASAPAPAPATPAPAEQAAPPRAEPAAPTAAPELTITFSAGMTYTVSHDVTNVGRSDVAQNWHPELDVIPFGGGAPDLGVSRHQALIQREGDTFKLLDVGSTNGTFVNGRALEYNKPVELHDGDSIAFGAFNAKVSIR